MFGIGIRYVGETVAKKLVNHFRSMDSLVLASYEELIEVDEIGDRIATSIIEYFKIEENELISFVTMVYFTIGNRYHI